jgi:hypothetical protein
LKRFECGKWGRAPSCSHDPQLLPVLAALRRRYKINKVRISRNMYDDAERPGQLLLSEKWLFNLALRTVGFRTTRIFTDLGTFIKLCAARPPRSSSVELMTHPGSSPCNEEANLLDNDWTGRLSYKANLVVTRACKEDRRWERH